MSPQGERVAMLALAAGMLVVLELGLIVLSAPLAVVAWPLVVALALAVIFRGDLRFVSRYGWWQAPRQDDPGGGSDGEPGGPGPFDPPGGQSPFDWDAFTAAFWRHVAERTPVGSTAEPGCERD